MSQVVVTNDNFREKRKDSLSEERKIDNVSSFQRWQMPVSKASGLIEKGLGIVTLPLFAFWGLILTLLSLGFGAVLLIFKTFALLGPRSRT